EVCDGRAVFNEERAIVALGCPNANMTEIVSGQVRIDIPKELSELCELTLVGCYLVLIHDPVHVLAMAARFSHVQISQLQNSCQVLMNAGLPGRERRSRFRCS